MSERASVESEDMDFILGPIRPWSSFAFFPRLLVETSVETRTCVHTRDSVSRRPVSFPFHLPLPPLYFRNSIANASLARPNSADPLSTPFVNATWRRRSGPRLGLPRKKLGRAFLLSSLHSSPPPLVNARTNNSSFSVYLLTVSTETEKVDREGWGE